VGRQGGVRAARQCKRVVGVPVPRDAQTTQSATNAKIHSIPQQWSVRQETAAAVQWCNRCPERLAGGGLALRKCNVETKEQEAREAMVEESALL
jgi:hypothetical protein